MYRWRSLSSIPVPVLFGLCIRLVAEFSSIVKAVSQKFFFFFFKISGVFLFFSIFRFCDLLVEYSDTFWS